MFEINTKKALSTPQKVILGMSLALGVILIFKGGYQFGQWLYATGH